jgi:hypothetical protein
MLILHTAVLGDVTPCSLAKKYWSFKGHDVAVALTAAASLSQHPQIPTTINGTRHKYSSLCDKQ